MKPSSSSATDQTAPAGQIPFTRADFYALKPRQQGYVSYYQAAWNKAIPDDPIYHLDSKEHREWQRGRTAAAIEVQEGDEC